MKISARGWSRDHGTSYIFRSDLDTLEPSDNLKIYPYHQNTLEIMKDANGIATKVVVSGRSEIQLSGAYLVQLELTAKDIYYMAWLTMKNRSFSRIMRIFGMFDGDRQVLDRRAA